MDDDGGERAETTPAGVDDPPLEAGILRFHRGAWFFGWIWALAHDLDGVAVFDLLLTSLTTVPGLVLLIVVRPPRGGGDPATVGLWCLLLAVAAGWRVYLGVVGRRWAWRRRRYRDVEEFRQVEAAWENAVAYVALGLCALGFVLQIASTALGWS